MGKTVLVTGGSRGIGKACALEFARNGYDVAVNYCSNEKAAEDTASEIKNLGVKAEIYKCDTSDLPEVKAMFRQVVKDFGGIDVLVNNAGIVDDAYLMMVSEDSLSKSLDINVKGYFHCISQAALKMMRKKSGVIINISSVSGTLAVPGQSVYSATKGAVNSMTAVAAKELAQYGIRVNAVAPGFIQTSMMDHIPEDKKKSYIDAIPMQRFGNPEEIAKTVYALTTDNFSYLTGQIITLDGGLSL